MEETKITKVPISNHLGHKAIVAVNDYAKMDLPQDPDSTDVVGLSIGKAQWDGESISLKIWRHTGKRWSPQSEEMLVHRCIDLNILFLETLMSDYVSEYWRKEIIEERATQIEDILEYYRKNECNLKPRLQELRRRLNEFLTNE